MNTFPGFALRWWEFQREKSQWEDIFCDLLADGQDYERLGTDGYDSSLEIRGAENDWRLTEEQQSFLRDAGFQKVYVNHKDGWETHYSFTGTGRLPARGWRRRYVSDAKASTTRVIAGPADNGYFEISYWPEGWAGGRADDWLSTGYMRIVSDPLDPFVASADRSPQGQDAQRLDAEHESAVAKPDAQ